MLVVVIGRSAQKRGALGSLDGLHKTPDAIALDEPLPEPSQIMRVDRDYSRSWRAELLAASAT